MAPPARDRVTPTLNCQIVVQARCAALTESSRLTMFLRVGYEIGFDLPQAAPMVVMLALHHTRSATVRKPEQIQVDPPLAIAPFLDIYGNQCGRLVAPAGRIVFRNDAIVEDSGLPDLQM